MQVVYVLAPVIAGIIAARWPGTRAREDFVHSSGGIGRPILGDQLFATNWRAATCDI
jgi:hypothetical protein